MKAISVVIATALASAIPAAEAATVTSGAAYDITSLRYGTLPADFVAPETFADAFFEGTGTAATTATRGSVSASAATAGASPVPMDYGQAQVFSRDRITFTNLGTTIQSFFSAIRFSLNAAIAGDNSGTFLPEGLSGAVGETMATLTSYIETLRADGTIVTSGAQSFSLGLGYGQTGSIDKPNFLTTTMNGNVNPGETVSMVFELSAFANAYERDPLVNGDPDTSPVPLPAGLVVLPGGLAMLVGLRRLRRRAAQV